MDYRWDGAGNTTVRRSESGPSDGVADYVTSGRIVDGRAIFIGNNGQTGFEMWTTDGTVGGTELLKDINTTALGASTTFDNFSQ